MPAALKSLIAGIRRQADRLADPSLFFEQHFETWLQVIKSATEAALMSQRARDDDPEEWRDAVMRVVDAIQIELTDDGKGFRLYLQGEIRSSQELVEGPGGISAADVADWVDAGIEGSPKGKQLDERDTRSAQQITRTVIAAIRGGFASGETIDRVIDFIEARESTFQGNDLGGLMTVWKATLKPILVRDYRAWLRKTASDLDASENPF